MTRKDGLKPCRFCGEHFQLQVIPVDAKNPGRDLVKCRECRGEAPRTYWNGPVYDPPSLMSPVKLFDDDGYPTQEALMLVTSFDAVKRVDEYLDFVKQLWKYPDRFVLGYKELYLSTGGWSGNESVIEAMRPNFFFWFAHTKWQRGGHYWFSLEGFKRREGKG